MKYPREDRSTIKTVREVVAMTPTEKQRVAKAAEAMHLTKSTYIRLAVLKQMEKDGF